MAVTNKDETSSTNASSSPILISADSLCTILTHHTLINHFRSTLPQASTILQTPIRQHYSLSSSSSSLLLMPCWPSSPSFPYVGVKLVTHFPQNSALNLPGVQGSYVLFSSTTGQTLASMDSTELTLYRTSCVSGLASKYLARHDSQVLVMVGAGALAPHLIKAHYHYISNFNVLTQIPIFLLPSSALTLAFSMATEEPTLVVEPAPEPAATESPPEEKEEPKSEAKAKKSKEPKPKKVTRPRNPPTHPSYEEMIKDAITSLKEKTGSSQYAIAKFVEEKHKQLPSNFRKLLLYHLKKLVAAGKLVKVKGSFKLPPTRPTVSSPAKKKKPAPAKPKPKPKPKPAAKAKDVKTAKSKAPVKAKPAAKPKAKAPAKPKPAAKPKAAPKPKAAAAKPKATKPAAKPKPAAAKPKAAKPVAKPKAKPVKAARTSTRTSPGKKAPAAKPAPKKVAAAAKKTPVKSVKPKSVKSPAKKTPAKRGGRK